MIKSEQPKSRQRHIPGLDSLRFLLAFWVMIAHVGISPINDFLLARHTPKSILGIYHCLFNGGGAVMAFFVISGFCIHLPFASGRPLHLGAFYLRRELRILPPVIAMFIIGYALGNYLFIDGIWSLVCEEVYYAIYPVLRPLIKRIGYKPILAGSIVVWGLMLVVWPGPKHLIWEDGYSLTWLLCLPVWISGAMLAEMFDTSEKIEAVPKAYPRVRIWAWRLGTFAVSAGLLLAAAHANASSQLTLIPFGLLACFWIKQEILFAFVNPPNGIFEKLGLASYSLYLCHPTVIKAIHPSGLGGMSTGQWLIAVPASLGCAALLYFIVERPSHNLARKLAASMTARYQAKISVDSNAKPA